MAKKILFGIPLKNHVNLAMDELWGMQEIGYECFETIYARNDQTVGKINKLFGVLGKIRGILKKLRKETPDILYLNSRFGKEGIFRDFLTVLVIRNLYYQKLRIVIKTHGSDVLFLDQKSSLINKLALPYLTRNVDLWLFLSKEEKKILEQKTPELARNIVVTSNIIDCERSVKSSSFLKGYNLDDTRFKFFFAGRMIKEKGVLTILRSIPLFEHRDKCVFIFAGDGDDMPQARAMAREYGIDDCVNFLGFLPEEECDHFYANVDALVFPTYFNEGFPMALFKSISCGLPVVTTRTRAAIDHLKEPDNCLWVDGKSERSVANALNRLFENEGLRQKMEQNNRGLGTNFTRKKVCMDMHQAFSGLF